MGQVIEAGAVQRYLACLAVHDWDGLAATIADDDLIREARSATSSRASRCI